MAHEDYTSDIDEDDFPAAGPKKANPIPKNDEFNVAVSIRLLETRLRVLESRASRLGRVIDGHVKAIDALKLILANDI